MPFNKIHVPDDLPAATCQAINDALHRSLVETCGSAEDDNFCLICRYGPDDRMLHPTFLGQRDPAATIVIEIALLAGRTDDQKEDLFRQVRGRLATAGVKPENTIIFLMENNPIDWSFSPAGSVKSALSL
ncbi:MAG: tautomerase family protein [Pseudomonadota bacterium]